MSHKCIECGTECDCGCDPCDTCSVCNLDDEIIVGDPPVCCDEAGWIGEDEG